MIYIDIYMYMYGMHRNRLISIRKEDKKENNGEEGE